MKIEEQVLSREQMAHLKELGVDTSDASMAWFMSPKTKQWKIKVKNNFSHELLLRLSPERYIPTYTIGDLIEKLPEDLRFRCQGSNYSFSKNWDSLSFGYERIIPQSNNLIEGLFTLLCWEIENQKELLEVKMAKTTYCGECKKFPYEDTDGFGICGKTNEECRCSDKCHLINGKP